MRPHLPLVFSSLIFTALAQKNDATLAFKSPLVPTSAFIDITVTQTIEIADYPTDATGLIYDTSPITSNTAGGTPMAKPTSVFITSPSNSTRPTIATTLAGNAVASKTGVAGVAAPAATTKSLGISVLDVRISPMWQGLLGVAIFVVVLC
ncbi:hypothetical protein EG328_011643 [Venturia inaequalis]|uniref:Uncharacterized protein n=1 Tax=Venturia inaequalis TaxID=5025 RepID=A0A8H3Z6U7_VENIN|nr:hypothetical protein EG328_011643 [Venturia inaequalis]KAE9994473.1 hypothetical protein EG327_009151 [Venturia inaequalis]RDI86310.1 hypothetical protein Vi05172_g3917 [Venturia inaequalis]